MLPCITSKFSTTDMFVIKIHYKIFQISVGKFMFYLYTKFHTPSYNISPVTAIKPKANREVPPTPCCFFASYKDYFTNTACYSKTSYHTTYQDPTVSGASVLSIS
jgi:hypothetical protein